MKKLLVTTAGIFFAFTSFGQVVDIVVPFRVGNKWGYSDTLGKIKIPAKYEAVELFDYNTIYKGNHVIGIVKSNDKQMAINEKGKVLVPPVYNYVSLNPRFAEPLFFISDTGKSGVFTKAKELFPPVYDFMDITSYGHFKVHKDSKYGLINDEGKIVIPVNYNDLREKSISPPDTVIWEAIIWGKDPELIKIKTNPQPDRPNLMLPREVELLPGYISSEDLKIATDSVKKKYSLDSLLIKHHTGVVFKNKQRGVFLPAEKRNVYFFSKPYNIHEIKYFSYSERDQLKKSSLVYITASLDGKYGIINEKEELLLPFGYDVIEEKGDFFLLKRNGKIGFFILTTPYPVVQPAYDEYLGRYHIPVTYEWNFTLFHIKKNGKTGFVGENGMNYFKD